MWCWSTPVYPGIPQEIADETTGAVKKHVSPSVSSLFQMREGSTHHLLECQAHTVVRPSMGSPGSEEDGQGHILQGVQVFGWWASAFS